MRPFTLLLVCLCAATSLHGEPSAVERDLAKLSTERDKAVAAALEPINRRYREALEKLLAVAMKKGDLNGAVAIKKEIERASALPASAPPPNPFDKPQDTKWLYPGGGWLILRADGTGDSNWGAKGKWKYLGNYKLTIDYGEKQTWTLDSSHEHLITRDGGRLTRAPVE